MFEKEAEEYAKEKLSKEEYKLAEEVIKPIYHNAIKNDYSFAKYGVECYLAGLKAGRPQWHDLRETPNDLPNDKEYVLIYTNLTNYYVAEKVDNHFMSKGWGFIPMSTVIAWCEIPTFDKE